jgi:hypothetical protein
MADSVAYEDLDKKEKGETHQMETQIFLGHTQAMTLMIIYVSAPHPPPPTPTAVPNFGPPPFLYSIPGLLLLS